MGESTVGFPGFRLLANSLYQHRMGQRTRWYTQVGVPGAKPRQFTLPSSTGLG